MGVGLPYTLQGCGSLSFENTSTHDDNWLYETHSVFADEVDDTLYSYCYPSTPEFGTQEYNYYVHGACVLLHGNLTDRISTAQMLYGGPGNIVADVAESFLAVSYIGIVFGIPCAVMALLNFAGVVRLAVKWEEQRILSITDAFGHSAIGPCFLAAAMFAFLATQYLYIFSATVTLTYTLEVLVVLTTVVLANILVLAVTGLLRAVHDVHSKMRDKSMSERVGTVDKVVHYAKSLNMVWFWVVVVGIFPLTLPNVNSFNDTTKAALAQFARLYFDVAFVLFAVEMFVLAYSLRTVYNKLKKGYIQNGFTREVQRLENSFQWWIYWIFSLSICMGVSSILSFFYGGMRMLCTFEEEDIFGDNSANPVDTHPRIFVYFAYIMHLLRLIYCFQVTYIFLHVALFNTNDKFNAKQIVPGDILSILRSTDVAPKDSSKTAPNKQKLQRTPSAIRARNQRYKEAKKDIVDMVLKMPYFQHISPSAQSILMNNHRVPETQMPTNFKKGDLIFPNLSGTDESDPSVILGIVVSGYVELSFDAWADEEAKTRTKSIASSHGKAFFGAQYSSPTRQKKRRPPPSSGELDGIYFEPHSYIYSRRIVVPVEQTTFSVPADAICVFRAKTDCSIFFMNAKLKPRPSPFGAGVAAQMRRQLDDSKDEVNEDNPTMTFDLSDGDNGTLFVFPLNSHRFSADRCSLAAFAFGLRDDASFSLDGLASVVFQRLLRPVLPSMVSTTEIRGQLRLEVSIPKPWRHYAQQLLPANKHASSGASRPRSSSRLGDPGGDDSFRICAWLRTAGSCLNAKPCTSRFIGRFDAAKTEFLAFPHRVCDIALGTVIVLAVVSGASHNNGPEFSTGEDEDGGEGGGSKRHHRGPPPILAYGCINIFNSFGELRIGRRSASTLDLTSDSSLGGLDPKEFFDEAGDEWVPKVVFTGANSQLHDGDVAQIDFDYVFSCGGELPVRDSTSDGDGAGGRPFICADLKMPDGLENPIVQFVSDLSSTSFNEQSGSNKRSGASASEGAAQAPKLFGSKSKWQLVRANVKRINGQRKKFKSLQSITETLRKNNSAMELLASTSVQGSILSSDGTGSGYRPDRATEGIKHRLTDEHESKQNTRMLGVREVMSLMTSHPWQVIRDCPELLPAISQNVSEVDWWQREVKHSKSDSDRSKSSTEVLALAQLQPGQQRPRDTGDNAAASEVEMVDMRSHAKSKSLPQKGINGIVEIMCHYDVLASLNVFDGEKCLTQALKLLCPLSSHPFARGIGVAYLLLLETHDLHGLIKLPQKLEMDLSLSNFVLQFVQALKFETHIDNPLARFLLYLADINVQVRKELLWSLHAEVDSGSSNLVLYAVRDLLLQQLDEVDLWRFYEQLSLVRKLTTIQTIVKQEPKDKRAHRLSELLSGDEWPKTFELGFRLTEFAGFRPDKCKAMSSKMVPLWLSAIEHHDSSTALPKAMPPPTTTILFKRGDDLRQDQLTVQFLRCLNRIWAAEGLDLNMTTYDVVAMGNRIGILEVVERCNTVANIMRDDTTNAKNSSFQARIDIRQAFDAAFSYTSRLSMLKWLVRKRLENYNDKRVDILATTLEFDDGEQLHKILQSPRHAFVLENFKRSCAAFCVASNILGIGDRHPSNLMLRDDGNYLHIDFGHFLGNFKSKFGIKRETAPFVFTHQFAAVLGGSKKNSDGTYASKHYADFVRLCREAFVAVRRHSSLLISLFNLMVGSGIPQISNFQDVQWLRDRLLPGYSEEEAADYFECLIEDALGSVRTQVNYFMHLIRHG